MKPYLKWTVISVGSIVAIAHIGVLGHLIKRQPDRIQVPTINIPAGTPYSSYKIEAGKDGYTIEYRGTSHISHTFHGVLISSILFAILVFLTAEETTLTFIKV